MIDDLCQFLEGKTETIVSRLRQEMESAAEDLNFERAAAIRDQILGDRAGGRTPAGDFA